jgi:hypothetical protein
LRDRRIKEEKGETADRYPIQKVIGTIEYIYGPFADCSFTRILFVQHLSHITCNFSFLPVMMICAGGWCGGELSGRMCGVVHCVGHLYI